MTKSDYTNQSNFDPLYIETLTKTKHLLFKSNQNQIVTIMVLFCLIYYIFSNKL